MMKGLFKLSRDIKIGDYTFKEIDFDDKEMVNKYIVESQVPITQWHCYFTYLWSYGQSNTRKVLWMKVDDLLCVFYQGSKGLVNLMTPPFGNAGKDKVLEVMHKCLEICDSINGEQKKGKEPHVRGINQIQLDWLFGEEFKANDNFKAKKSGFGTEYHYDNEALMKLEGKDFAYIRRKINKFHREFPDAVIRPYEPSDWDGILTLQREWNNNEANKYFRVHDASYYRATVKDSLKLGHIVLVAEINNKIVGMISGEVQPSGDGLCFLRKPLSAYEGLSEMLITELAKHLGDDIKIMNDGGGGSTKGLNYFKQRFRPAKTPQTYTIFLNK